MSIAARSIALTLILTLAFLLPASADSTAQATIAVLDARVPDAPTDVVDVPPLVSAGQEGREILFEFASPIEGSLPAGVVETLTERFQRVDVGYDTLLLQAPAGARVNLQTSGSDYMITLETEVAGVPQQRQEQRLRLLQAVIDLESGQTAAARDQLRALHEEFPEDTDIASALAQAEFESGNWRGAVRQYDEIIRIDPANEDAPQARRDILREYGRRAFATLDWQKVRGGDTQIIGRSGLRVTDESRLAWEATGEYRTLKQSGLRHVDGSLHDFNGTRQWTAISASLEPPSGSLSRGTLFYNFNEPGLGLDHSFGPLSRRVTLTAAYAEPYMDYPEAIAQYGVRHRIGGQYAHRFGPDLFANAALYANRYDLDDLDGAASTLSPSARVSWAAFDEIPELVLGYGVDANYTLSVETRTTASGEEYRPLPVTSTEIHTLDAVWTDEIDKDVTYRLDAGYSYDRLNSSGFNLGGEITWRADEDIDLGANLRRSFTAGRGGDSQVWRSGLSLLWRF